MKQNAQKNNVIDMQQYEWVELEDGRMALTEESREQIDIIQRLRELDAIRNYEVNDLENSRLFFELFGGACVYNATAGKYMNYIENRWVQDAGENLGTKDKIKRFTDIMELYARETGENDYIKKVRMLKIRKNRNNILRDAEDLRYITADSLDNDIHLLNVQNGTIDLRGKEPIFREHAPDDYITKICNVKYDTAARSEQWEKFVDEVMQGDKDKIRYLQKLCGISLTGETNEEKFYILLGTESRNGKSTFCETITHMLGDYAMTMQAESLAKKSHRDSRNASGDIARLRGARLVIVNEPDKGMVLDAALIKTLTGGDKITARHLYSAEFEFRPQLKLVINTNYLPQVTDDTIFASGRVNVVTFNKQFSEEERDIHLKDRLKKEKELSGVLNWCLDGLRLYRKEGLKAPECVRYENEKYRKDSDKIQQFLDEQMTKSENEYTGLRDVFKQYSDWCREGGLHAGGLHLFKSEMMKKTTVIDRKMIKGKAINNAIPFVFGKPPFEDNSCLKR